MSLAADQAVTTQPASGAGVGGRVRLASHLAIIAAGSLFTIVLASLTQSIAANGDLGIDYAFYRDVGAQWLTDGSYYLPHQLAGPYDVALMVDVLYPPTALALFVPAAILPWPVWWIVPIAVTLYVVAGWRPSLWGIAGMLLLLAWPRAAGAFLFGNTDMWAMAGVAAGLRWGWPAIFLTLKPTFAPLVLLGIRHRSWWLAAAVMVAVGLVTLSGWRDYLTVMLNLRAGADYALGSLPILAVPFVAWWMRPRAGATSPDRRCGSCPT